VPQVHTPLLLALHECPAPQLQVTPPDEHVDNNIDVLGLAAKLTPPTRINITASELMMSLLDMILPPCHSLV
jgi:hypothetical protein